MEVCLMATALPLLPADCRTSLRAEPLADADAMALAEAFRALGDPVRLRILNLLATAPDGPVCACDLVEPVGKSQPTVSHHLRVLREAGLVTGERRGTWVYYAVAPEQLDAVRGRFAHLMYGKGA
jgi:ArsR family transcriptional regulator